VRPRVALIVLAAVVVASTVLNLVIMHARLAPLYTQVENAAPGAPGAAALHARLTAVAQSELSRSIAMEGSTLVLGFVVFTRLRRRPVS
jgi:hypothetical protein